MRVNLQVFCVNCHEKRHFHGNFQQVAAMDFGKFRFCGCALQYAEMRVGRNRPHLQLPSFLRTCLTGICIGGAQKQSLPKLFVSNPFFVQAGHGLDPLEANMRIISSRWLMCWTYAARSCGQGRHEPRRRGVAGGDENHLQHGEAFWGLYRLWVMQVSPSRGVLHRLPASQISARHIVGAE